MNVQTGVLTINFKNGIVAPAFIFWRYLMNFDRQKALKVLRMIWIKESGIVLLCWTLAFCSMIFLWRMWEVSFLWWVFIGAAYIFFSWYGTSDEYQTRAMTEGEKAYILPFFEKTGFPIPTCRMICGGDECYLANACVYFEYGICHVDIGEKLFLESPPEISCIIAHEMAHRRCLDLLFEDFKQLGAVLMWICASCLLVGNVVALIPNREEIEESLYILSVASLPLGLVAFFFVARYFYDALHYLMETRADVLAVIYTENLDSMVNSRERSLSFFVPGTYCHSFVTQLLKTLRSMCV